MTKPKPRRRKHRGTQAGTVQRRARTSRPIPGAQQGRSSERRRNPLDRPPSWRTAVNRAVMAAGVFLAVLILLLKRSVGEAVALSSVMLVLYIPMGYSMDSLRYRMVQRRRARQKEAAQRESE